MWRACSHLNRALGCRLGAFSGSASCMSKASLRNIAAEGWGWSHRLLWYSDKCFLIALRPQRQLYSKKGSYFKNVSCSRICFYNHSPGYVVGTESILNFGGCYRWRLPTTVNSDSVSESRLSLYFSCESNKMEHGVQSCWQGRRSEKETSTFSHFLGVLARSNRPQSQHHQLNLIHKFDHPCAFKRNIHRERTTFQNH